MNDIKITALQFNYKKPLTEDLVICAAGFEERALKFTASLKKAKCKIGRWLLFRYESQKQDNEPNYKKLKHLIKSIQGEDPKELVVNSNSPIQTCFKIKSEIERIRTEFAYESVLIDISGMTHLWAIYSIHSCLSIGMKVSIVCTEAKDYFPKKVDIEKIEKELVKKRFDLATDYLQSAGLKEVQILPEFGGNFRPGSQTCLVIFVGYEPHRIEGLINQYAPSTLIAIWGRSPHKNLQWRTEFSKSIHAELLSRWHIREVEVSTLFFEEILSKLEEEFNVIKYQYDVAIAPQCSKMQAFASYLFWRSHPETQLIFTTPVRFHSSSYSKGVGKTYFFEVLNNLTSGKERIKNINK
ncbi:MAG: hypothetical protein AB7S78_12595 [Candidatus Omnitrophota bacterium]